MAMTKKELAEMEALKTRLALRFWPEVLPDIQPPKEYSTILNGYSFNAYSKRVKKACTSSRYHSLDEWDKTDRRDSISLYSTAKLAYMAMLHEVAEDFARELRAIEKRMEAEE